MDAKILDAAQAYGAALGRAGGAAQGAAIGAGLNPGAGSGSAFGSMVEGMVQQTTQAVGKAENISAQAVNGQADLVDVVTAISNAEMVMDSVTTVRDRVLSAYQEIMRMPI